MRQSAYLLGLLHRLDSEMHHHFTRQLEALTRGEAVDAVAMRNGQIDRYFAELRQVTESELAFVAADEHETESDELPRLEEIYTSLNGLLSHALETYRQAPTSERANRSSYKRSSNCARE